MPTAAATPTLHQRSASAPPEGSRVHGSPAPPAASTHEMDELRASVAAARIDAARAVDTAESAYKAAKGAAHDAVQGHVRHTHQLAHLHDRVSALSSRVTRTAPHPPSSPHSPLARAQEFDLPHRLQPLTQQKAHLFSSDAEHPADSVLPTPLAKTESHSGSLSATPSPPQTGMSMPSLPFQGNALSQVRRHRRTSSAPQATLTALPDTSPAAPTSTATDAPCTSSEETCSRPSMDHDTVHEDTDGTASPSAFVPRDAEHSRLVFFSRRFRASDEHCSSLRPKDKIPLEFVMRDIDTGALMPGPMVRAVKNHAMREAKAIANTVAPAPDDALGEMTPTSIGSAHPQLCQAAVRRMEEAFAPTLGACENHWKAREFLFRQLATLCDSARKKLRKKRAREEVEPLLTHHSTAVVSSPVATRPAGHPYPFPGMAADYGHDSAYFDHPDSPAMSESSSVVSMSGRLYYAGPDWTGWRPTYSPTTEEDHEYPHKHARTAYETKSPHAAYRYPYHPYGSQWGSWYAPPTQSPSTSADHGVLYHTSSPLHKSSSLTGYPSNASPTADSAPGPSASVPYSTSAAHPRDGPTYAGHRAYGYRYSPDVVTSPPPGRWHAPSVPAAAHGRDPWPKPRSDGARGRATESMSPILPPMHLLHLQTARPTLPPITLLARRDEYGDCQ